MDCKSILGNLPELKVIGNCQCQTRMNALLLFYARQTFFNIDEPEQGRSLAPAHLHRCCVCILRRLSQD